MCRFVNDEGKVLERFLGLKHIEKCTSIALKEALVDMISSHKLSMSMIRGQGYDGASNMRGEFNGVQKLVRDQNPYAFYVHCFAHQLQLVVVAVSTSTPAIADFFNYVPLIVNTVGASCMRKSFCDKNEIEVPDMDKEVNARGTSVRRRQKVTNMHFYHVEIFLAVIDAIMSEMNHRFSEVSSELLVCMACLNPRNSFSNFDVDKLVKFAEIYAEDFDIAEITVLPSQLRGFIGCARRNQVFLGCTELSQVSEIMVKHGMHKSYPLVYRLIELTLILLVATVLVERIFLAMSIIKTDLRNKMGDEWLNDLMICYTEKELFRNISNEKIIKRFNSKR